MCMRPWRNMYVHAYTHTSNTTLCYNVYLHGTARGFTHAITFALALVCTVTITYNTYTYDQSLQTT